MKLSPGMVNYEKLSRRTLTAEKKANSQTNGRSLLPITLGITDECQHMSHTEVKVNYRKIAPTKK